MKEIVKQSCFNFQSCKFHGLITVRDCSHLMSTSFFAKIDHLPLPPLLTFADFHEMPLHSCRQIFKTNPLSKKTKAKTEEKQQKQHQNH